MTSQDRQTPAPIDSSKELALQVGLKTDVGPVRKLNEDFADYARPTDEARKQHKGSIFVVADGMGGHQAGEVASRGAVDQVINEYYADAAHGPGDSLVRALKLANQVVYNQAQADASKAGMGTTMVAAVVLGRQVYVANVGDSRAYLINEQGIGQITQDHSWVEEQVQAGLLTREQAGHHPQRNLITRALGHKPAVDVDLFVGELREGHVLLLCSDGLHGVVSDQQMAAIVSSQPPEQAAVQLVELAKAQNADDNISVVIVRADQPEHPQADVAPGPEPDDETPTALTTPAPSDRLASARDWLRGLLERLPVAENQRRRVVIGLVGILALICLCAALVLVPALGQSFAGEPAAAPQPAPIRPERLAQDDPGWWAVYLGYADLNQMLAAHNVVLDAENPSPADLWPARQGMFIVGVARAWNCTGTACTFQVEMAGFEFVVHADQAAFAEQSASLDGQRVRVFGYQQQGSAALDATLIDEERPWWVWWRPGWVGVYKRHDWGETVWVYATADRNPYSPVNLADYAGLVRGDRLLLRGAWLQGETDDPMTFEAQSVYRLDAGKYFALAGQPTPMPLPTVTLRPPAH